MPFVFVSNTSLLLDGEAFTVILSIITAAIGIYMLAIGIAGYPVKNAVLRISLISAAVCMIITGVTTDLIGIGIGAVVLTIYFLNKKKLELNKEKSNDSI